MPQAPPCTPGARAIKPNTLVRPLSGIVSICFESMVPSTEEVSVCTSGAAAVTFTVVAVAAHGEFGILTDRLANRQLRYD